MSAALVLMNNPDLERRGPAPAPPPEAGIVPIQSLPLGYRFRPTDVELINHYLKGKIDGSIRSEVEVIPEIDVCKCEPWDLPDKSVIRSDDPEWFFFAPKDRKYPNGHRSNRATEAGYWKATGKDRVIRSRAPAGVVGMKKTLVFHRGRAPKGLRTCWIMHEYRTTEQEYECGEQGGYVLYRLFKKQDDTTSNSNSDVVDRNNSLSLVPPGSSPGDTQHELDTSEEFVMTLNQESPASGIQEEQQSLPSIVSKQPTGTERWPADKSDCSTTSSIKPEEINCIGNVSSDVGDHEAEVGAKVDSLLNELEQSCDPQFEWRDSDGFPIISSPMLHYNDYPFFSNVDHVSNMDVYRDENGECDALNELLNTVLSNQDEYAFDDSYACCKMELEGNMSAKGMPMWNTASDMDGVWSSCDDTKSGPTQGEAGLEASDHLIRPPVSCDRYSEVKVPFSNDFENASLLPYDSAGPDVYSVDCTSVSLQGLFNSMEESSSQRNNISNAESLEGTGIKRNIFSNMDGLDGTGIMIRARKTQIPPNSYNSATHQGGAKRRIRLQRTPIIKSYSSVGIGSSTNKDHCEDKVASIVEEEHAGNSDTEGSFSCASSGSSTSKDDHEDKVAAVEEEDNETNATEASVSYEGSESSTSKDDHEDKVAAIEEGESVEDGDNEKEISGPINLDKLKNLSIIDDTAPNVEPSSEKIFQEPEPILRLRRTWSDATGESLKVPSLHQKTPQNSAVVYIIRSIMLPMILLLLSAAIWRSFGSRYV